MPADYLMQMASITGKLKLVEKDIDILLEIIRTCGSQPFLVKIGHSVIASILLRYCNKIIFIILALSELNLVHVQLITP
ncbi:hypothetical protein CXF65_01395 [Psychrobacter sp. Sarcosine-3u-12]|nr:hypothetical protein CXF65_01395 [Psychrobacter sp. Sarcosine-3u-12]